MAVLRIHRIGKAPAFSLIEIVLALAIISFALVGIIGMFPVALDAATNSQRETQAAFIAHSLYSELASMPGTNTFVSSDPEFYDQGAQNGKISINLTQPRSYYLSFDTDGKPLKPVDAGTFASGSNEAIYLARITVSTDNIPAGLSRVDIRVDAPGITPEARRKPYYFSTLFNQGENQ